MARSAFVALVTALMTFFAGSRVANAWVEVHVSGAEAVLTLDRQGKALVEQRFTLQIAGGPLPYYDLVGVDADATPEADGYVAPTSSVAANSVADATPVETEVLPPKPSNDPEHKPLTTLRVRFADGGLERGSYSVLVRYKTDLARRGLMTSDGAIGKVRWTGPTFSDGFVNARATFDLAAAPTPPALEDGPDEGADELTNPPTVIATLKRAPERDRIELMRPYVAKGESVVWSITADRRAIGQEKAEVFGVSPVAAEPATLGELFPVNGAGLLVAAGAIFMLYALLVGAKWREVVRASREAQVTPRPWIQAPIVVRAAAAGLCLLGGVWLQFARDAGTLGAAFVGLAALLAAYRTPVASPPRRGPGKWLPITEAEAFRAQPRPRGALFDVTTREGKALLAALLIGVGFAVAAVARVSPYHATLLGLDATALLAVFATGRLAELPADRVAGPAPFLAKVARQLRKRQGHALRLTPKLRLPAGEADADELRLGVAPRRALPGFVGIELGVVYAQGAGGSLGLPEILVRMTAGSECEAAFASLSGPDRLLRGRRPDERVLRLTPRLPTANLVARLLEAVAAKASRPEPPAVAASTKRNAPRKPKPTKATKARPQPGMSPASAAMSAGSGEVAVNAGTELSPLQAT